MKEDWKQHEFFRGVQTLVYRHPHTNELRLVITDLPYVKMRRIGSRLPVDVIHRLRKAMPDLRAVEILCNGGRTVIPITSGFNIMRLIPQLEDLFSGAPSNTELPIFVVENESGICIAETAQYRRFTAAQTRRTEQEKSRYLQKPDIGFSFSMNDSWVPSSLRKFKLLFDEAKEGDSIGTYDNPREFRGYGLLDIQTALSQGLSQRDAINSAIVYDFTAAYIKKTLETPGGSRVCRIGLMMSKRPGNLVTV